MSSSASRAPVRAPLRTGPLPDVQPFPYDTIPAGAIDHVSTAASEPAADQSVKAIIAREAQAREQGRQQGMAESRETFEHRLQAERSAMTEALTQFAGDRAEYFQKVEAEVVQLSLAIARKILHREAQLDPLLLAGSVRVALEKISGAAGVVLRVNPQIAAEWQKFLAAHLKPADLPRIIEDPAQPAGCCRLETSMGTTEIGIDLQLKEIEQGLLDLMAARPDAPKRSAP